MLIALLMKLLRKLFRSEPNVVRVGESSPLNLVLPSSFEYQQLVERTLFFMPGKIDENGPVSFRISHKQDLSKELTDEISTVTKMVEIHQKTSDEDPELMKFGSTFMIPHQRRSVDDGIDWLYLHHLLVVEGHLCIATTSIVASRTMEGPVHKLRDSLPGIFESLHIRRFG